MPYSISQAIVFLAILGCVVQIKAQPSSAPHPRLFLTPQILSALNPSVHGSNAALAVKTCDNTIASPSSYTSMGYAAFDCSAYLTQCALAWHMTGQSKYAQAAMIYFNALLDDLTTVGDGAGGNTAVTHDDGYNMRTYATYAGIGYDWLHGYSGFDTPTQQKALSRFSYWMSWYNTSGYHNDLPASNYHAGWTFAATMISIAVAGEDPRANDYWHTVVDILFNEIKTEVTTGPNYSIHPPLSNLVGGDWPEGFEYGPLSIFEYAMSTLALEQNGYSLPFMEPWIGSVVLRHLYALTPDGHWQYVGGDTQETTPNTSPADVTLLATILGPTGPDYKAWARAEYHRLKLELASDDYVVWAHALAETDTGPSYPFNATFSPVYYTNGTGRVFYKTSWSPKTVWAVMQCRGQITDDHIHFDAGNFVINRGGDDLLVDPSPYGSLSTMTSNAPAADSSTVPSGYSPSQASWGASSTNFVYHPRTSPGGVAVAKCDYSQQFAYNNPSDVSPAWREYVIVPIGFNGAPDGDAIVFVVDRAKTPSSSKNLYIRWRTQNTQTFVNGATASATAINGKSAVRFYTAYTSNTLSATKQTITETDCFSEPDQKVCFAARFQVDDFRVQVPGPQVYISTVIDVYNKSATPSTVSTSSGSASRTTYASRGQYAYAVTTSSQFPVPTLSTLSFSVSNAYTTLHVVLDCPMNATGYADVVVTGSGGNCAITLTPHTTGTAIYANPASFWLTTTCSLTEEQTIPASTGPQVQTEGSSVPPAGPPPPPLDLTSGATSLATDFIFIAMIAFSFLLLIA